MQTSKRYHPFRRGHCFAATWQTFTAVLASILTIAFLLLRSSGFQFSADLTSYLAPAVATLHHVGAPYTTYFDIKPPGLILVITAWISLFGYSLRSLVALNTLLLIAVFGTFWFLLRKAAKATYAVAALLSACVVAVGYRYFVQLVPSETIGLAFTFGAVLLLLRDQRRLWAWLVAGLLFALAGQVKEAFFFSILSGVWLAASQPERSRSLLALVAGWILGGMTVLLFLLNTSGIDAYREVLEFKASLFPISAHPLLRTLWLSMLALGPAVFLFWFAPLAALIATVLKHSPGEVLRKALAHRQGMIAASTILFLTLFLGCLWQSKPPSDHYEIALWFPFVLMLVGWLDFLPQFLPPRVARYGSIAALACLIPAPAAVVGTVNQLLALPAVRTAQEQYARTNSLRYSAASQALAPGGCLQQAYGWDAGAAYIYTGAPPCSRYFLPNITLGTPYEMQLRADLTTKPPSVVIYDNTQADMNTDRFERMVFPWKLVLSRCYKATSDPAVFSATSHGSMQSQCIVRTILETDDR